MVELYPVFGKMKMLRQWGGIVDICPDASPIISKCDIDGLFLIVAGEQVVLKLLLEVQMFLHIPLQKMNLIKLIVLLILIDLMED